MNELALFAGAGGGILGGQLLGWKTVCAVENDEYARNVLVARQNDGTFPPFPIWDDVRTFDGRPWQGIVDVVSGGFPCQDISIAGNGCGIDGARSGLWSEMARIIDEVRPRFVWVENSPMLVRRGLARVLSYLAEMGYDAVWGVVGADDAGAPHKRKRIWILAYSDTDMLGCKRRQEGAKGNDTREKPGGYCRTGAWWKTQPGVGRVANGMEHRTHRLRALGNGQVPQAMKLAFETLCNIRGRRDES